MEMTNVAERPANETERLKALMRYEILDSPPDGSFDHLTQLASVLFNIPIAIISLVDEDRIWFKSKHGLEVDQIERAPGLCASAIMKDELYIVENAIEDPRTLANPLVAGKFGLRFYAAAPIISKDGFSLGTFCLIDRKQRYLTEPQKEILQRLADIVMDEMELRLAARNLVANTSNHMKKMVREIEALPADGSTENLKALLGISRKLIQHLDSKIDPSLS